MTSELDQVTIKRDLLERPSEALATFKDSDISPDEIPSRSESGAIASAGTAHTHLLLVRNKKLNAL
ncbi:MAG: hypothetical protein AAB478_04655 [Patescibacteria group bacterium]